MIKSAWIGSKTATNTISGTSMASPHIAGIIASYLSRKEWRGLSTKELKEKMIKQGTNGVLDLGYIPEYAMGATPNVLVFTNPPEHDEEPEEEEVEGEADEVSEL
jgi:subtilisin family serine protease